MTKKRIIPLLFAGLIVIITAVISANSNGETNTDLEEKIIVDNRVTFKVTPEESINEMNISEYKKINNVDRKSITD